MIAGSVLAVGLQHREIATPDRCRGSARVHLPAVVEHELDVVGAVDDVMVGEHVAVGRRRSRRSRGSSRAAPAALAEVGEEAPQQRVVEHRAARAQRLARVDVHDRRHRVPHGVGVARRRGGARQRSRPAAAPAAARRRRCRAGPRARGSRSGRSVDDDEQHGEAQRAGLREQQPEAPQHRRSLPNVDFDRIIGAARASALRAACHAHASRAGRRKSTETGAAIRFVPGAAASGGCSKSRIIRRFCEPARPHRRPTKRRHVRHGNTCSGPRRRSRSDAAMTSERRFLIGATAVVGGIGASRPRSPRS